MSLKPWASTASLVSTHQTRPAKSPVSRAAVTVSPNLSFSYTASPAALQPRKDAISPSLADISIPNSWQ